MMRLSIEALAEKCSDAESTRRYGGWIPSVRRLRAHGYNDQEIEHILRSKLPRWAADEAEKPFGKASARDLLEYLRKTDLAKLDQLGQEMIIPAGGKPLS